ncbi:MAG: hypothetical protein LBR52_04985 [Prevotellaceae bacterium]|jgi:hypothetical protein|nr:hypothetical protein [Prevotellaceae bacterium]
MTKKGTIISYLLGIALIVLFITFYNNKKKKEKLLNAENKQTIGIVIKTVKTKRSRDFKYEFYVSGQTYDGWAKNYNYFNLNDTVNVIYYPKNPKINKAVIDGR